MRTEFCYVEDIYTPSAFYGCYFSKCRQLRPSTKPLLAWFWNLPVILIAISANAKNPCQAREYIVFPSPSNSGNACVRFHENPEGWPTFGVYRIIRNRSRWLRLVYMHKPKEATNTLSHLSMSCKMKRLGFWLGYLYLLLLDSAKRWVTRCYEAKRIHTFEAWILQAIKKLQTEIIGSIYCRKIPRGLTDWIWIFFMNYPKVSFLISLYYPWVGRLSWASLSFLSLFPTFPLQVRKWIESAYKWMLA